MVMHDFELILHEMKLRRESLQNAPVKYNDSIDGDFDNPEVANSPVDAKVTVTVARSRKIARKTVKRKSSKTKKNVNRRILKLLKTSKLNVSKSIASSIGKNTLRNKSKEKKLREHKCKRCDVKFDTKVITLWMSNGNFHLFAGFFSVP